jgi:hypothetical protein
LQILFISLPDLSHNKALAHRARVSQTPHLTHRAAKDWQNNHCRIWLGGTQRERDRESFSGNDEPHGTRFFRKRLPTLPQNATRFPSPLRKPWLATLALVVCSFAATATGGTETLHSPDGRIRIDVQLLNQQPHWSVRCDGDPVIVDGLLGIRLEPDGLGKQEIAGTRTDSGGKARRIATKSP